MQDVIKMSSLATYLARGSFCTWRKTLPKCLNLQILCRLSTRIDLIGAPVSFGQEKKGTELGPKVIRSSGFIQTLEDCGWRVHDHGDLDFSQHDFSGTKTAGKVKNVHEVSACCHQLANSVSESVKKSQRTIVLGGDHSLAIGSISGHATVNPNLCVIWIDAHADINTVESTPSGNLHGMSVSFLMKEMQERQIPSKHQGKEMFPWIPVIKGSSSCGGIISAASFAYIGIRDVDQGERNFLQSLSSSQDITIFTAEDVIQLGGAEVMSRVLDKINHKLDKPIHVSFDIDALDPEFAPSTGAPVQGGISLFDAIRMAKVVAETNRLSALDLVEVNPLLGDQSQVEVTAKSAHDVIVNFIGERRRN